MLFDFFFAGAGTSNCTIKAGGSVSDTWNIGSNANWCDLTATVSGLGNWLRRLAEHMEHGSSSTT